MILYIVGFTRAGKSTMARSLAKSWDIGFLDTDDMVEELTAKSIQDRVQDEGWEAFRTHETNALYMTREHDFASGFSLSKKGQALKRPQGIKGVVACGGGIVEKEENRLFLKEMPLLWLNPGWEVLLRRIKEKPSLITANLSEDELYSLYQKRMKLYQSLLK
ncbi:MAG: hypothetical protein LHW60_00165 [Candidatus Cloacimonetes bacterium]|nr:hypothetical protein [Candidatus Cloacimonadota bacterium]